MFSTIRRTYRTLTRIRPHNHHSHTRSHTRSLTRLVPSAFTSSASTTPRPTLPFSVLTRNTSSGNTSGNSSNSNSNSNSNTRACECMSECVSECVSDPKKDNKKDNKRDDIDLQSILIVALITSVFAYTCHYFSKDKLVSEEECSAKIHADFQPGNYSKNNGRMSRIKQENRLLFEDLASVGVAHGAMHGTVWRDGDSRYYYQQPYWNDEAAYEFSTEAIVMIRNATHELHSMSLEVVDLVVESDELLDLFEIPVNLRPAIRESWRARESDFLGRFDFLWDGTGSPKLLEYNADTPTILAESAAGQELWSSKIKAPSFNISTYESNSSREKGGIWCFNFIQDKIVEGWPKVIDASKGGDINNVLHILHPNGIGSTASSDSAVEEREHLAYVKQTAILAGLNVKIIDMTHLENLVQPERYPSDDNGDDDSLSELKPLRIFKSYPYEWLSQEAAGELLFPPSLENNNNMASTQKSTDDMVVAETCTGRNRPVKFLEPPWKLILGNKMLLAMLWEMYPNHPNLLYATYNEDDVLYNKKYDSMKFVAKPKYGREGVGVAYSDDYSSKQSFVHQYASQTSQDKFAQEVFLGDPVYQQFQAIHKFSGRYCVLGSWVIHGESAGICVREDSERTTNDNTSFVPHYVSGIPIRNDTHPLPKLSSQQLKFRSELYDQVRRPKVGGEPSTSNSARGGGGGFGGGNFWWWNSSRNNGDRSGEQQGTTRSGGGGSGGGGWKSSGPRSSSGSTMHDDIKKRAGTFKSRRGPGFGSGKTGGTTKPNGAHGRAAAKFSHSGLG